MICQTNNTEINLIIKSDVENLDKLNTYIKELINEGFPIDFLGMRFRIKYLKNK